VLSWPLLLLTLGLFTLVINGILLFVVSSLLRPHFEVDSFKYAFWGAVLISLVSMILNALTGVRGSQRVTNENPEGTYQALERYGRDLTELARTEKLPGAFQLTPKP
jgi:hypothetical protein